MSNEWTESDVSLTALKKCFQSPVNAECDQEEWAEGRHKAQCQENVWLTWLCAAPQIVLSQR